MVEHDQDTIAAADYLVDIGPGAGKHGGEIVAEGVMPGVLNTKNSLTCEYLRGEKNHSLSKKTPLAREGAYRNPKSHGK